MLEQLAGEVRAAIASGHYGEARELVDGLAARVAPEELPQALELLAWARQAALCACAQIQEELRGLKPPPYAAPRAPRRRWQMTA